ncbi:c6 zinc finger domain containing protein [Niveomyces insectorum RCEF 264]|uniref:C6 zinc finger domain containing protein n=1 Tax=Niveomyces insectorum RCEF 264 TaxID=1081102 RepID=A0A167SIK4_9HYPO|nr:c6 zinc finger domain containing protein [Niveomyces insectorum RCEF 264]
MISEMSQARKKRSKTGCYTCRQRKVRCNEQHPTCGACLRLGLSCSFPAAASTDAAALSIGVPRRKRQQQPSLPNTTALRRHRQALSFATDSQSPATLQDTTTTACSVESGDNGSSNDGSLHGGNLATAAGEYQPLPSSWWSSLGEGLLDVNWLESWVPELDDHFLSDASLYGNNLQPPVVPGLLPSSSSPVLPLPSATGTSPPAQRNVTLLPEDRQLLHHFTTTMVRFCILRNCTHDNLYSYILMNMGLFHSTLFDAMMAWSALHLAHIQKMSIQVARARYDRAYTALIEDLGRGVAPTLLLATAWFLLQYQLILAESVESFCELIDLSAEVARAELQNHDAETAMKRIGPVGSLILVWMNFRDSQAAHLGLGGRLLGCLKTYPYIYDLVDTSSISNEGSGNSSPDIVFMEREQISGQIAPSEMQTCMKLSFQNVTVAGQIKFLGRSEMTKAVHESNVAVWETIRSSLGLLRRDIELDDTDAARAALGVAMGDLSAMPVVDPIHYNRLLLLVAYYTTVITYYNNRPGDLSHDPELLAPEMCADRMIRLCQRVEAARPDSPQGIWPTHALIAGTTTRDPIYQAWAVHSFEKAERWGAHIVKARILLDAVIRKQNATGKKANIVEVMKETTGVFIF